MITMTTTIIIMTTMIMTTTNTITMTIIDSKPDVVAKDPVPEPLKRFIWDIQSMVELADSEREILMIGRDLMTRLLKNGDWLPAVFAMSNPAAAQQFHIYADNLERFAVVSTVLPRGAALSIEQPSIWEIVGVLRGALKRQTADGATEARVLQPGTVETRPSKSSETVQLGNASDDEITICVHVYGGDMSRLGRRAYALDGMIEDRSSGYANTDDAPPYDIMSIQTQIVD